VMLVCTLVSGILIAAIAVPGLPLPVLVLLLFLAFLLEPPFLSARAALLTEVLPDDRYLLASTASNITQQVAQVVGFAGGGVLVAVIGPRPGLLVDGLTFLAAAALILISSPRRPAAIHDQTDGPASAAGWLRRMTDGARLIAGHPRLRILVALAWLATFWVIPEGLAAPYAQSLGGGTTTIGLILAAQPAGTVLGGIVVTRLAPLLRERLMLPLAGLAGASMLACALDPPLPVVLAALAVSGVGCSYQLIANFEFMQTVPNARRGQAFGLAVTGLTAGSGLGIFAGGAAAGHWNPAYVVAAGGAIGLLAVSLITVHSAAHAAPATAT
jgi:predicted MFS family arabinose efflux permease